MQLSLSEEEINNSHKIYDFAKEVRERWKDYIEELTTKDLKEYRDIRWGLNQQEKWWLMGETFFCYLWDYNNPKNKGHNKYINQWSYFLSLMGEKWGVVMWFIQSRTRDDITRTFLSCKDSRRLWI